MIARLGRTFLICILFTNTCLPARADTNSLPIFATSADQGMQDMLDLVQPRSLYLLGDASHGTREYYLFRQKVTMDLIQRFDLRLLILEAEEDSAAIVDQWVNNISGNATNVETMLHSAFSEWPQWMWANQQVVGFVKWLRMFNTSRPVSDRVRIHGMDMQNADTDTARKYHKLQSEDIYAGWNFRANHMASVVAELVNKTGAAVVWAHNNHVADKVADDVKGTGLINMGQLLRQQFGTNAVFILGSAGYHGTLLASRQWGQAAEVQNIEPAIDQSLSALLYQSEWPNPLLFWNNPAQKTQWDFQTVHRNIGVVNDPDGDVLENYVLTSTSRRYDAVVFWKTTTALQPL